VTAHAYRAAVAAEFDGLVPESDPFREPLSKIFYRKIKRVKKKAAGADAESEVRVLSKRTAVVEPLYQWHHDRMSVICDLAKACTAASEVAFFFSLLSGG
jgi:hypothetical protein